MAVTLIYAVSITLLILSGVHSVWAFTLTFVRRVPIVGSQKVKMIRTMNSISIKFFIGMHLFILAKTISKNQHDTTEPPCSSEPASEVEVER